jgi:hypothetical protein
MRWGGHLIGPRSSAARDAPRQRCYVPGSEASLLATAVDPSLPYVRIMEGTYRREIGGELGMLVGGGQVRDS